MVNKGCKVKLFIIFIMLSCSSKLDNKILKGTNEDRIVSSLKRGDLLLFKAYFEKLKDKNFIDNNGNNLFHLAIKYEQSEILDFIISKNLSFNFFNNEGKVAEDFTNKIEIKRKINDFRKLQRIIEAVKKDKLDVLIHLIEKIDLSKFIYNPDKLLLFEIIEYISPSLLKELVVSKKLILDITDKDGNNILMSLSSLGKLPQVIAICENVEREYLEKTNFSNLNFIDIALNNKQEELAKNVLSKIKEPQLIDETLLRKIFETSNSSLIDSALSLKFANEDNSNFDSIKAVNYLKEKDMLEFLVILKQRGLKQDCYVDILIDLVNVNNNTELVFKVRNLKKIIDSGLKLTEIRLKDGNYLIHKTNNWHILEILLPIFNIICKNNNDLDIIDIVALNEKYDNDYIELIDYILSLILNENQVVRIINLAVLKQNVIFLKKVFAFNHSDYNKIINQNSLQELLRRANDNDLFESVETLNNHRRFLSQRQQLISAINNKDLEKIENLLKVPGILEFRLQNETILDLIAKDIKNKKDIFNLIVKEDKLDNLKNILLDLIIAEAIKKPFPLHNVIEDNNLILLKEILKLYPEYLNQVNKIHETPLIKACIKGNLEIVSILLNEKNIEIDFEGKASYTALMDAVRLGHEKIIIKLLEFGANVDAKSSNGRTSLMLACENEYLNIIKLLLEKNANVDYQYEDGWTALMYAVEKNSIEIVKLLLKNNADINIKNKEGNTVYLIADKNNYKKLKNLFTKGEI